MSANGGSKRKNGARLLVIAAVVATALQLSASPSSAVQFCNTSGVEVVPLPPPGPNPPPWIATPYPSNITVSGLTGTITDLNVNLNGFASDSPSDLDFLLVGPQGQNLLFMSDAGGDNSVFNPVTTPINLTIDDQAPNQLPGDTPLVGGGASFRPIDDDDDTGETMVGDTFPAPAPAASSATALTVFNGTDPNGTWSLYLMDDFPGPEVGEISSWCVDILTTGGGGTTTTAGPTTTSTAPTTTTTGPTTTTTGPTTTTTGPTTTTTGATTTTTGATTTTTAPGGGTTCFGQTATIVGTANGDVLAGTAGNDVIVGLGGNDRIDGGGGDDRICGGDGDDVINGGAGNDQISGGNGNDRIEGGDGNDTVQGDEGNDILSGGPGNDTQTGGNGNDVCSGGAGTNALTCEQQV
jgi:Ca2+-binding RTX toxin-like protein